MSREDLELGTATHQAIAETLEFIREQADGIATRFHLHNATALNMIGAAVAGQFQRGDNGHGGDPDGRTAKWRCRFRIYAADHMDEPVADTDDELPPDRPGAMVLAGLPAVASEVSQLAHAFHQRCALAGLSREELDRRLRALRPTLSRRGGNAVWRVPYDTLETFNERSQKRGWLMRVDITREETKPNE